MIKLPEMKSTYYFATKEAADVAACYGIKLRRTSALTAAKSPITEKKKVLAIRPMPRPVASDKCPASRMKSRTGARDGPAPARQRASEVEPL